MTTMTERQLDTLLAIVSYHRVYEKPVTHHRLQRFLKSGPGVLTSHLCRLIQWRLVRETKDGFKPSIDGECFVIGCKYVGDRDFGHSVLSMYAA